MLASNSVGEHKRKQSEAIAPDGTDAFIAIAQRLDALKRPVAALLPYADKLPAGDAFAAFAMAIEFASSLYERYLERDAAHWNSKLSVTMDEAASAPLVQRVN